MKFYLILMIQTVSKVRQPQNEDKTMKLKKKTTPKMMTASKKKKGTPSPFENGPNFSVFFSYMKGSLLLLPGSVTQLQFKLNLRLKKR